MEVKILEAYSRLIMHLPILPSSLTQKVWKVKYIKYILGCSKLIFFIYAYSTEADNFTTYHYNDIISLQSRDIHMPPGSYAKILRVKILFVFIDIKKGSFEYK